MALRQVIQQLNHAGITTDVIAEVCEVSEDFVHETLDRELNDLDYEVIHYREHEVPKVREALKAMIAEYPKHEAFEARRLYLLERIRECKHNYATAPSPETEKELGKALFAAKLFMGVEKGITQEVVARAREFPIERLVESKNHMAKCPFHNDHTPSMYTKKNFFHCFGCGASGDVIDFVMRTENVSFLQAVKKLT